MYLLFFSTSKQTTQTLTASYCLYLMGALLLEQEEQTTLPQALQWCLLTTRENSRLHSWHMVTRWSGIHTGAESPRHSSAERPHSLSSTELTKLAFLLMYSSIALLMASTHSFLSSRSLTTFLSISQRCSTACLTSSSQSHCGRCW